MTTALAFLFVLFVGRASQELTSARAHLGKGTQWMQVERFKEAAEEFEQALRDDPDLAEARQQLAMCRFELRNYVEAREVFQQLLASKQEPGLSTYYLGRLDLAEENFDSAIRHFQSLRQSGPIRDELYYLGFAYFKTGRLSEAAEVLQEATAENPRDYRCRQLLARSYQKLGEHMKAEKEFNETQRLHDYYLKGSVAISECRSLLLGGQAEEAWQQCRPLLQTDDVDKVVSLGMVFGKSGDYGHALEIWEKAIAMDPDSVEINYNLALTAYHLNKIAEAARYAAVSTQLRPQFFEANMLHGTILYMLAQDEAAVSVLTHAHELRPDDEGARKLLAQQLSIYSESLVKKNQLQRAKEYLQRAAALQPGSKEISDQLAQLRARMRQHRVKTSTRYQGPAPKETGPCC